MQTFLPVIPKLSFITVFFFFNLFDQEFSQGSHIAFSYHASLISFTLEKSPHTYFLWIFFLIDISKIPSQLSDKMYCELAFIISSWVHSVQHHCCQHCIVCNWSFVCGDACQIQLCRNNPPSLKPVGRYFVPISWFLAIFHPITVLGIFNWISY